MGHGIFTTHARKVLIGCGALLAVILAVMAYYEFRSPVGGISPYEMVNELYEWEFMTFAAEQSVYPSDVENVVLTFRNDAPDGVVVLSAGNSPHHGYQLEVWSNDAWHQMRAKANRPAWDGATDIVTWNGGEETLSCPIGSDYPTPLEPGLYRIVLPQCEHMRITTVPLAAEFEVVE